MSYESLKESIVEAIRPNGNQEITGQLLQDTLVAMVDEMEAQDSTKASRSALAEAVEPLAREDGSYPQMSVGFAENLVGDGSATPEEFSFRPTAGEDRNVANTTYYEGERNGVARIEKIKGNSVVSNQIAVSIVEIANFRRNLYVFTSKDKKFTVKNSNVASNIALNINIERSRPIIGHFYAVLYEGNYLDDLIPFFGFDTYATGKVGVWNIAQCTRAGYFYLFPFGTRRDVVAGESFTLNKVITIDLTQMFGVDNEPMTSEELWQRLPIGVDINAYNEGEIVDGNYGAIKTTGFNAFNGTYAKVCGGCPYFLGGNYSSLGFATEEGGTTEAITLPTSAESVGTTPSDRLYTPTQNGYIYAEGTNININLSWDTEYGYLNGTLQPYKPFERDLSWVNNYFPATINGVKQYGMRSAGSVRDVIRFNSTTQKWEAVQNVGVRAYASGDESNSAVITDGTTTNYALTTPIVKEIEDVPNMDFDVSDYGTEELIAQEGKASAPIVADIAYAPNALSTLKQVPDILARLKALEAAVASATSTTNMAE